MPKESLKAAIAFHYFNSDYLCNKQAVSEYLLASAVLAQMTPDTPQTPEFKEGLKGGDALVSGILVQVLKAKVDYQLPEQERLALAMIDGQQVDAIIKMPHQAGQLAVEVKRWAQQANIGVLVDKVQRLPIEGILVADYINPNMAKTLKEMNVQFIDVVGNAYINQPPVYIHVAGNKQTKAQTIIKEGTSRAFDATGLKVIFGLLCDPMLVNAAYRKIAEQSGVALGSVGRVLNDLKDAGFIIDRGYAKDRGKGRRLVNQNKLLDRWVEAYPEKLKPKQLMGEFVSDDPYWWKAIDIEKYDAYWGGELAAAKYTDYLKPQIITIYLPEHAGKTLLAKARLRKATERHSIDTAGLVIIVRPFWPLNNENAHIGGLVNPLLVYADLMATGDSRNLETARMMYERYIAEHIGEDCSRSRCPL